MIIQDKKGGPLYSYVEKDVEKAEIAIGWISKCPGAILAFPGFPTTFIFKEDVITQLVEYLDYPDRLNYLLKKASEEGFWEEFYKENEERNDLLIDELLEEFDLLEEEDPYDKLCDLLFDRFISQLHTSGGESDAEQEKGKEPDGHQ